MWPLLVAALLIGGGYGLYGALRPRDRGPGAPGRAQVSDEIPRDADAQQATPAADGLRPADRAFNPGFIGAPCASARDCLYDESLCLGAEDGFPAGTCSRACNRLCPDQHGDLYAETLCVESPVAGVAAVCLAQCNLHLTDTGCRPGYICTSLRRVSEAHARLVCLPDRGAPAAPTPCTLKLAALGLTFARPDLADVDSRGATPEDPKPETSTCLVDTPVLLASPLAGVDFRAKGRRFADHLLVACAFAPALNALAKILARHGVVEAEHNGTFVCRGVAGTRALSRHGQGLAIDLTRFERATDTPLSVAADWRGPDAGRRRALRELVKAIRAAKIFDLILTPASNAAHRDHLHLEVKAAPLR